MITLRLICIPIINVLSVTLLRYIYSTFFLYIYIYYNLNINQFLYWIFMIIFFQLISFHLKLIIFLNYLRKLIFYFLIYLYVFVISHFKVSENLYLFIFERNVKKFFLIFEECEVESYFLLRCMISLFTIDFCECLWRTL